MCDQTDPSISNPLAFARPHARVAPEARPRARAGAIPTRWRGRLRHGLLALLATIPLISSGCAIIGPGERGVKRTLGELDDVVHMPGTVFYNFFVTTVVRLPVRTVNLEVNLALPSKEGLTVQSEISILYRIRPESVPAVLENIGEDYARTLVLPTFRSAAADISARHNAKDMHSSERSAIEGEIATRLRELLSDRGFEIEKVLLKSIVLPSGLSQAIEEKLGAEQEAQRMQFVLDRERREAERRIVEATGIRDAQLIIDGGLTPMLIQYRSLEAFRELARSPNAKVIFTNGRAPLLLDGEDQVSVPMQLAPGGPAPASAAGRAATRASSSPLAPAGEGVGTGPRVRRPPPPPAAPARPVPPEAPEAP